MNPVVRRSVLFAGHKTSISLEDEFCIGLKEIAQSRGVSASAVIADINAKDRRGNLSSAVRVFVLEHYQRKGVSAP